MYTRVVKANAWKWLCGMGCFFIPELFPGGRCVPEGRRCHCEATSLSLWCPFSPFPTVTCYLKSPWHMCTSLEQGYNYHCSQEACSVFSVFKQFIGNFIYYMVTLKCKSLSWCFPSSPGLMRGWQWSAPNLRWRKSRTNLYWSPFVLEISIIL